jgi:hypothetical protein
MQQRFSPTEAERACAPLPSARSRIRWGRKAVLALVAILVSGTLGAGACGGDIESSTTASSTSGGGACVGGILVDGRCEGKCTPDKCIANNTCVGNRCLLKCDSHNDCYTGIQSCAPAVEDDTNVAINVCQPSGIPAPIGAPCPFGTECQAYTACPDGRACDYRQCSGMACTRDEQACDQDPNCAIGKCPDQMTACTVPSCPQDQCKAPLVCRTTGAGDADAFCTAADCKDDNECPGGLFCGIVRDPHEICNSDPKKGNNDFCGTTAESCLDLATLPAGTSYFEGSVCVLRRMCLRRTDCTACENDLDCSIIPGQRCVGTGPAGADKRCLADCNTDTDCGPSYHCVSGSCAPRFPGGCKGTGQFCEPCQSDEDCGSKGSKMACVKDDLSGERACLDLSFPTVCMSDLDCPTAPSGKHGRCIDNSASSIFQRCYLPFSDEKYSCW